MTTKFKTYPKYKPSGINWLGDIPEGWSVFRVKNLFQISKEKNRGEDLPVLSLAQSGIRVRDISTHEGQLAASYESYTRIRPDDLVFNPMDLRSGAVDLSNYDGVISLAYTVLRGRQESDMFLKYYKYYFQWHYLDKIFFPFGQGVSADHRWTLQNDTLMNFPIPLPPLDIQKRIADFLDEKTKIIDELIAKKKKLIELLREKRAALITHAVTKGLNPNAKLKPSGIEWLGEIPEGWGLKRNRFLSFYIKGKTADLCTSDEKDCLPYLSAEVIRGQGEPEFCRGSVVAKEEQILLLWDGANAGEFFWAGPGVVSSTFSLIVPRKKNLFPKFYFWLLKGFEKILRDYTQGMGVPHVSPWILQDSFLPEVPLEEQKRIADFLDAETAKIDKAVSLIESLIKKLKEYRSSLIYHVVTGKMKI